MINNSHDDEGSPIDRAIRKAMEDGKFDNLSGQGQPFPKEVENPWEDPSSWAAHRILKSAGFSLPWIEERNDIESQIISSRASLIRSYRYWRDAPLGYSGEERIQAAFNAFRERCDELNRQIRTYNLKTPIFEMQLAIIDVEREIALVMRS